MTADAIIDAFGKDTGIFTLMNTAYGWPIAESLHFIGLALLLGTIGIVDLRLLGYARAIPLLALHALTRFGVIGFVINVVTGLLFFVSAPDQYLYNPAVQLKMLCILIAGANVVAFYSFAWPRIRASGDVGVIAKVCAGVSLGAWLGAILFGRLITFYRPPEHWCAWCGV
jgi:hypothetical protein